MAIRPCWFTWGQWRWFKGRSIISVQFIGKRNQKSFQLLLLKFRFWFPFPLGKDGCCGVGNMKAGAKGGTGFLLLMCLARWISLGMMITCSAYTVHQLVSSKRPIRNAFLTSCNVLRAEAWNWKSVLWPLLSKDLMECPLTYQKTSALLVMSNLQQSKSPRFVPVTPP